MTNGVINLLFVFSQKWTKTSVIGHDSITTIILKIEEKDKNCFIMVILIKSLFTCEITNLSRKNKHIECFFKIKDIIYIICNNFSTK